MTAQPQRAFDRDFRSLHDTLEHAETVAKVRAFESTDADGQRWAWFQDDDGAWSPEHPACMS